MILTITALVIILPYSHSLYELVNSQSVLDNTSYTDYETATGGQLINVALRKEVTLDAGMNCNGPAWLTAIRAFPLNSPIHAGTVNSGSTTVVNCRSVCSNAATIPNIIPADSTPSYSTQTYSIPADSIPADSTPSYSTPSDSTPSDSTPADSTPSDSTPSDFTPAYSIPADSTPSDSRTRLENGQNVIIEDIMNATYLLSLSTRSLSDGQSELIAVGLEGINNITLKIVFSEIEQSLNLLMVTEFSQITVPLNIVGQHHIVVMVVGGPLPDGVSILLNGTVIYSQPDIAVNSLTLSTATAVFDYKIEDWKIFDRHISTQELYLLTNKGGQGMDVSPAGQCNCPEGFPIFDRWPRINSDHWRGVYCSSVVTDAAQFRVNADSHIPQFVTDGNDDNYWVSATDTNLTKLTIDLVTTYQIFYAEITLLAVPKHLVITKKKEGSDVEEVLFVATDNCTSNTLPNGLPQGPPMTCTNSINVFKSASGRNYGSIKLIWANSILFPELHPDNAAFAAALGAGKFEAQTVSIYMYGYEAGVNVHTVNELKIFGSCGCSPKGSCSLSHPAPDHMGDSGVSGVIGRFARAAAIPDEPLHSVEINLGFTFEQTYGFVCNCSSGYRGSLCQDCPFTSYTTSQGCQDCICGNGSYNNTCSSQGQCFCSTTGIGKPEYANKQCNPFVYSVEPSYGPVAGGTKLLARGGWLSYVDYIYVGSNKCFSLSDSAHNDTHFSCETEKTNVLGEASVYTDGAAPIVNFTYKPDPNITKIGRVEVTTSGGVDIPIFGTNLDSIANPKIVVDIICLSTNETIASLQGDCEAQSSDEMNCISPDFTGSLADSRCAAASKRRRKRAVDDNSKLYEFVIGFLLDGVDEFKKASDSPWLKKSSQMFVRADPEIHEFGDDDRVRRLISEQHLEVSGRNMESGVILEDYVITVGTGDCKPIALYHNLIKCTLPEKLPEAGVDYVKNPYNNKKNIPAVVVNIGNLATQVGYVVRKPDSEQLVVIAVTVSAVVVVIIIIAVVVVCIRMRKHTQSKRLKKSAKMSTRYVPGPHGTGYVLSGDYLDPEHMLKLKDRLIPLGHLELGNALGQGQFGKVFAGSLQMKSGAKRKVAVKTMRADLLRTDVHAVPNFLQEATLMKDFDHPNVLSLIGVVLNEDNIPMVVIPLMSKGDLKHVLRDDKEDFAVGDLLHFGLQAAYGMDYLAKKKFIHRDLAARNCMVDEQYMVKIADFGLSHDIYAEDYYRVQDKTKPLPVKWMAIESLTTGRYTIESDVWSYGILLWETLTRGESPYPGVNNYDVKDFLKVGRRLNKPDFCPDEVYDLMCMCWDLNPKERPQFYEICEILSSFMNKNGDYQRYVTNQIDDDYLVQNSAEEDSPLYANQSSDDCPPPDYDIPEPGFEAPGSPISANKSNNNSNQHPPSSRRGYQQNSAADIEYLQPVPSVKKQPYAQASTRPGKSGAHPKSSKSKPSSEQMPDNQTGGFEFVGRKLATQQQRSEPNSYLKVF